MSTPMMHDLTFAAPFASPTGVGFRPLPDVGDFQGLEQDAYSTWDWSAGLLPEIGDISVPMVE